MQNYDSEVVIPVLISGIIFLVFTVLNIRKFGFKKWFFPVLGIIILTVLSFYLLVEIRCKAIDNDEGWGICFIWAIGLYVIATPIVLAVLQVAQFFIKKKTSS